MNIELSRNILRWLSQQGVRSLCLCPGGRNAPLVAQLEQTQGFEVFSFYDERSAAFFALGRSRRDQEPVAVFTTSGTAVSETLNAVIEAHYSKTPLVIVSADRPPFLRGTGAPQTIEQVGIFGEYVENVFDLTPDSIVDLSWSRQRPLHINLCFDEPLIDENIENLHVETQSHHISEKSEFEVPEEFTKPLIVLSGMNDNESKAVESALQSWRGPIFAECLSGLKSSEKLKNQLVKCGDPIIRRWLKRGEFDSVIRIGDVPLGRFWRDLDKRNFPVLSLSSKPFSGLKEGFLKLMDLAGLSEESISCEERKWFSWQGEDQEFFNQSQKLLSLFPESEVALIHQLSQQIEGAVFLGNSMPVRVWDLVVRDFAGPLYASRGANGIDGQVSTAFGFSKKDQTMNILLGDLTTLYDFSGFWPSQTLKEQGHRARLFVINNGGGQIFSRLFASPLFLNSHNLQFKALADMWGWSYQRWDGSEDLKAAPSEMEMVEVVPHPQQSHDFWQEFDSQWLQ
ncbi:MAG: 2-succinyl-5-enolpyruvyl-6-hydroxy-3-cyclohexene-1-carboxylic-acid synthase [Bdellovibrionales bacterium]|nr:2-succinyl-5-enolpyruvyl-6-hydroxy-3-cyclohexene-1-carboxylic-acid synthase [Bdellovibrionales bacterium]